MSTYYDLLRKPALELTYDEKIQLERAEKIPPSARKLAEARVTELCREIMKLEKEQDELRDWLNGFEYVPDNQDNELPF